MSRFAFVLSAFLIFVSQGMGDNLFFNSGFELGDAGYTCVKYLRPETNKQMLFEGPVFDGSVGPSGGRVMRIPNRFAEQTELFAREFKLEKGAKYTFSLWMKSGGKICRTSAMFCSVEPDAPWVTVQEDFNVGSEWRRYSFTFTTDKLHEYYTFRLRFCEAKNASAGDLWIDGLQLDLGGEQPYRHGTDIEAAAKTSQSLYIRNGDSSIAKVDTTLSNNTAIEQNVQLTVDTINDYDGAKLFSKEFKITLAPHEVKDASFQVPLNKYGSFLLQPKLACTAKSTSVNPGYFAVVGKYETTRPLDPCKSFCVGLNNGGFGLVTSLIAVRKTGFLSLGLSLDDYVALLGQMGCRLVRDWDDYAAFSWWMVEPNEGKFDFTWPDLVVGEAEKHGMQVIPVLGGCEFFYEKSPWPHGAWPKWLEAQCHSGKTTGYMENKGKVLLPPLNLWRRYVHEIAQRYKGRIRCYEVTNEPNAYILPNDYMKYLVAASEELRSVDPQCKVIGFSLTGDLQGQKKPFLKYCLQEKGLNFVDIVSFHPYDSRELSSVTPADAGITELKDVLREFGGATTPLWNTELYYLYDSEVKDFTSLGTFQAHHVARRFLTDLGEGVGQSIGINAKSIWKPLLTPHFWHGAWRNIQFLPSPNYVALNALARMFEGASLVEKILWNADCVCYVYKREGKYIAAFWNYGGMKGLTLRSLSLGKNAQFYDLFGNAVSPDAQPLSLQDAPYYLIWSGSDTAPFLKTLHSAQVDIANPVTVSGARLLPENKGWSLGVCVRNESGLPVGGDMEILSSALTCPPSVAFTLPAASTRTIKIPVIINSRDFRDVHAILHINDKTGNFPVTLVKPGKVIFVGQKSCPPEQIKMVGRGENAVHQASFSASCDGHDLKISVTVKDATPSGASNGRLPWEQDCVELFLDAAPELLPSPEIYHDQVARLFLLPYAPVGQQLLIWPGKLDDLTNNNVSLKVETSKDGYVATVLIPLKSLDSTPSFKEYCIGFDVAVDDAKGTEKASNQIVWNAADRVSYDRLSFGFMFIQRQVDGTEPSLRKPLFKQSE